VEQRPFRTGQVLEPVGEDRRAVPRAEVGRDPLGSMSPEQVAVPEPEAVELVAVGGIEPGHVAVEIRGIEKPRLELGDAVEQRLWEPAEPCGAPEPVQAGAVTCDRTADDERPLRVGRDTADLTAVAREPGEHVVERADGATEECRPDRQQLAFDPVDVRPDRHDEHRLAFELVQIAPQQKRHLPGVRRSGDERQTQPIHATSGS
jgi:hypothetical protein